MSPRSPSGATGPQASPDLVVRRIEPGDASVLRSLRLAALADTPSAFGSTYDAEAAFPAAAWEERAQGACAGPAGATFFAVHGDEGAGMVAGYRKDLADDDEVELVSMWVAPGWRGRGAARMLVTAVVDWARDTGARSVSLWVTRGNEPAERLYRAMGFRPTGAHQPLPSDPCKDEVRMTLSLPDQPLPLPDRPAPPE